MSSGVINQACGQGRHPVKVCADHFFGRQQPGKDEHDGLIPSFMPRSLVGMSAR